MMRTVQIELATFQAREQAPAAVPPAVVPAPPIDAVVLAAPESLHSWERKVLLFARSSSPK
jgi:hypothetical protein